MQRLIYLPGSFCPSPIPPTPGQPCNLRGALDCHYENLIDRHGLTGNCCCGQCDIDMTCAPGSTDGTGVWQPKHSTLCLTEGCGSEGECIPHICHGHHGRCPCKIILSGVKFSRLNAKHYIFYCFGGIFVYFCIFLGVKFCH